MKHVGTIMVVCLALSAAWVSIGVVTEEVRLPSWDGSEHGKDGLILAHAVRTLDPALFVSEFHRMSYWPPAFPLMEMPLFLAGHYGYTVPRYLLAGMLAASIILVWLLGNELHPVGGLLTGAIASALMYSSLYFAAFSTTIMLELPGALFGLLLLLFYIRYITRGDLRNWTLACVAGLILVFIKYNYAILWLAPVVIHEALRAPSGRKAIRTAMGGYFQEGVWKKPFVIYLQLHLALIVVLFLGGGGRFTLFGQTISMKSAGNPTFLLIVVLVVAFLVRPSQNMQLAKSWLGRVGAPARRFVFIVILPLFAWLLSPDHVKNLFNLIENRHARGPELLSMANLLYYPEILAAKYTCTPLLGWIAVALALALFVRLRKGPPQIRIVLVLIAVGVLLPTLHQNKEARYLYGVVPLVWIAFGYSIGAAISFLGRRWPKARALAVSFASLAILGAAMTAGPDRAALAGEYRKLTVTPDALRLVQAVADAAAASPSTTLFGYSSSLSPGLIEWECLKSHPRIGHSQIPVEDESTRDSPADGAADRLASSGKAEMVIFLVPLEEVPEPRIRPSPHIEKVKSLLAALETSSSYRLDGRVSFEEIDYRMTSFKRVGSR